MFNFKTWSQLAATVALGALGSGCAHDAPPPELVDARAAYQRAQYGEANELVPAKVHDARVKLDKAERAYKDDGQSAKTRDMAYVAQRAAQSAEVEADTVVLSRDQQRQAAEQKAKAERAAQQELSQAQQALAQERAARQQAEARTQQALASVAAANALALKNESRGTVITLPGNVMFASGKSQLLAGARQRLDQIATALKEDEDHQIVVEGHTDSKGDDARNQELSQARAEAVRGYLVSRGLDQQRVRAEGLGETRPVADNETSEGRATNRRVEIVVEQNAGAASSGGASTGGAPTGGASSGGASTGGASGTPTQPTGPSELPARIQTPPPTQLRQP
jgi:outer membrane protein OmpA-like peptidoglycan-associated protein